MSFEEWYGKVIEQFESFGWPKLTIDRFDVEAWKEMYDDGLSVDDAIREELRE